MKKTVVCLIIASLVLLAGCTNENPPESSSYKSSSTRKSQAELNRTQDLVDEYWKSDAWETMDLNDYLKQFNASL